MSDQTKYCVCGNPKTRKTQPNAATSEAEAINSRLASIRSERIALAEEEATLKDRLAKILFR